MIKCDKGNLEIRGTIIDLMAELATLIHALRDDFKESGIEKADDIIMDTVKKGLMTEEEIDDMRTAAKSVKEDLLDRADAVEELIEMIRKRFKGKE